MCATKRDESARRLGEYIPLREAAQYLHRKPSTLYRWRYDRRNPIPHYEIAGRIFFLKSDLDRFIESGAVR